MSLNAFQDLRADFQTIHDQYATDQARCEAV